MPIGWKLNNGSPSDGVTWQPGNNNVTVTSDLTHGDLESIKIRPSNFACGIGLQEGHESLVSISRPAPTLSISGPQAICTGISTYTINGLPPGATVSWSLSNSTYASIPNPSNNTTVDVTRIGTTNTTVTLLATVTDCVTTYPPVTKEIALGPPTSTQSGYISDGIYYPIKIWDFSSQSYNDICTGHTATTEFSTPGATNVTWTRTYAQPTNTVWWHYGDEIQLYFYAVNQTARFQINASNACGSFIQTYGFRSKNCEGGCFQYKVSPNPAKGNIKIIVPHIPAPCYSYKSMKTEKDELPKLTIAEIRIYDQGGMLKQIKKLNNAKEVNLNISGYKTGIYIIEISDGKFTERQQVMIHQ